jgi:hypothetical protein
VPGQKGHRNVYSLPRWVSPGLSVLWGIVGNQFVMVSCTQFELFIMLE